MGFCLLLVSQEPRTCRMCLGRLGTRAITHWHGGAELQEFVALCRLSPLSFLVTLERSGSPHAFFSSGVGDLLP